MSSSNLLSGSTPLAARRGCAVLKNRLIMFFHRKCKKRTFCLCTIQNVLAQNKTFWYEHQMFLPVLACNTSPVCQMCLLRHTFTDTWGLDLCQIVKNNNKRETFCRAEQFGKVFLFIYKCSCFPKLDLLPQGKKVGDARCEYVFDVFDIHTVFYSELGSGHSLIFSRFAIRSPLNFFLWIADAPAFIF